MYSNFCGSHANVDANMSLSFSGGELKMRWKWESRMKCGREGERERENISKGVSECH